MKKICLAFMCLALFPFSVNAASIEDILGEWQSEKPMPFKGIEHIVISKNSIQTKPRKPEEAKIEKQDENCFIAKIILAPEINLAVEELFCLQQNKLLRDYPTAAGKRAQAYYIRPPKSPDHQ
ncbi:MAG TPA: hypothetical protein H9857_11645 [Candidatus Desulfovibrio intestinigallinarum]|nr:hypothetical protein [Candidatus Desulfovibrio intestinigallinarum]